MNFYERMTCGWDLAEYGALAVAYGLSPSPAGNPVVNGHKRLRSVAVSRIWRSSSPDLYTAGYRDVLSSLDSSWRLYPDAIVCRAVEQAAGLPQPEEWDDVRLIDKLLGWSSGEKYDRLAASCFGRPRTAESADQVELTKVASAKLAEWTMDKHTDHGGRTWLKSHKLYDLYTLERSVGEATIDMIRAGITVDTDWLERQLPIWRRAAKKASRRIQQKLGRRLDLDSRKVIEKLLFRTMGLPFDCIIGNIDYISHDRKVFRDLARHDPSGVVELLSRYRQASALARTGAELLQAIDGDSGRIHPVLDPLSDKTGRFGCRAPALFSLPHQLQRAFVARPDHVLLLADFSQLEMRALAHLAGSRKLRRAYAGSREFDVHRRSTAIALGIRESEVTEAQRNEIGKPLDLRIIEGRPNERRFSRFGRKKIFVEQDARFLAGYPSVQRFCERIGADADMANEVRSFSGRRHCFSIRSKNDDPRPDVRGSAVRHVVFGTSADILKLALVRLHKALPGDCRMVLPFHNAILLEIPSERAKQVLPLVQEVLEERPPGFSVPLAVRMTHGRTWADL